MIATIGNITVMGTPEEIERYREIVETKKKGNSPFLNTSDGVPEHVKNYGKDIVDIVVKQNSGIKAWY
ncbi:hypothetical protein SAMN05877753_111164 [Bacillus oleivorans]|uniref:Uncharacterized protein n=1 Tax=Bacillus oleivorans TaxID=1448271 RepID=A0A285D812_9BACI|nr:hypothetical protein [Bacillus oleivorans]SNX75333.1 hypothetical protein SAMN05877753_111164 [Bacillus oleivorans]